MAQEKLNRFVEGTSRPKNDSGRQSIFIERLDNQEFRLTTLSFANALTCEK